MIRNVSVPPALQQARPWTPGVPGFTPAWDLGVILHLSRMAEGHILEIGCNQGSTTYQLALANPDKVIYAIDWSGPPTVCPEQVNEQDIAKVKIGKAVEGMANVCVRDMNSRLLKYQEFCPDVGFVFVDGDHSYQGVKIDTVLALEALEHPAWVSRQRRAILWHDYCPPEVRDKSPAWLQVGDYLRKELVERPLIHFSNTSVAALLLGEWPENLFEAVVHQGQ